MGRGESELSDVRLAPRGAIGLEIAGALSGELPLLDADRIEDHTERVVEMEIDGRPHYGNLDDDRAIERLVDRLRHARSTSKLDPEELEDRAIEIYNRICEKVRSGGFTMSELARSAALLGESPEHLEERLSH